MKKVKRSIISVLLALSMMLVVNAIDVVPENSTPDGIGIVAPVPGDPYFNSYVINIAPRINKGEIAVSCSIMATDFAQQLGVVIVEVKDLATGEVIKTVRGQYEYDEITYDYSFIVPNCTSGRKYYAEATYMVQFSSQSAGSKYITSGAVTAP